MFFRTLFVTLVAACMSAVNAAKDLPDRFSWEALEKKLQIPIKLEMKNLGDDAPDVESEFKKEEQHGTQVFKDQAMHFANEMMEIAKEADREEQGFQTKGSHLVPHMKKIEVDIRPLAF